MDSLRYTCPGRGESSRKLCRCGAVIFRYMGYETTAQMRTYNADGSIHDCPWLKVPDTVECTCHEIVYRYEDGRRLNLDYTVHMCGTPITHLPSAKIAHREAQPAESVAQPGPTNGNGRRHAVKTGVMIAP